MASGTPVVAAAVGEIPSFVDDGTTGLLYPAADNDRLATAILRLLRDREFASGIGRRARAKILADHTWASVARRVIALAEPLTGQR
jgi:glycosyltransferase involved in cell wall biosynthesis